jgi:lipopolysaccharide/colanic/teichoic acid biosynthesis glycosyltransferase
MTSRPTPTPIQLPIEQPWREALTVYKTRLGILAALILINFALLALVVLLLKWPIGFWLIILTISVLCLAPIRLEMIKPSITTDGGNIAQSPSLSVGLSWRVEDTAEFAGNFGDLVYPILKRLLDLASVLVALVVWSPVLLLIAVLIKLDSPGPAFTYRRVLGRHGIPFNAVKFRTMYIDGFDQITSPKRSQLARGSNRIIYDPRITRIGRFLRRTSLDEMPQLLNVLRGQLSLVGPRIRSISDMSRYTEWHKRRLAVTPGLTGLWQISMSNGSFDEMVQMDIYYIEHRSIAFDLKILLLTAWIVLRSRGAY